MATAAKRRTGVLISAPEEELATPQVTGYDPNIVLFATRYKQGGRTGYTLNLTPEEIRSLIGRPDPKVATVGNRMITETHAADFARYVHEFDEWVSPAILLRTPYPFEFTSRFEVSSLEVGTITIPRQEVADIQIVDGQHRILGFFILQDLLRSELDKARSQKAAARRQDEDGSLEAAANARINDLQKIAARMTNERITVDIIVVEDVKAYRQIFFDIADNQKGITGSVKARFDSRQVVNRALEHILTHPLLENRVDLEGDRARGDTPYLFGAKHVAEITRTVTVGLDGRVSKLQNESWNELEVAKNTNRYLDILVESFPPLQALIYGQSVPGALRKTSLLGSVIIQRILAGTYYDLKEKSAWTDDMVEAFFKKLAPHLEGPVYPGSIWLDEVQPGIFVDGAMGPSGKRQDIKTLKETVVGWAIDHPSFLDQPPAPRPVPEIEPVDVSEPEADAILRPEIAKAKARKAS